MRPLRTQVTGFLFKLAKDAKATENSIANLLGRPIVFVSKDECIPTACEYECVEACSNIHQEDTPLYFTKDSLTPQINNDTCKQCLACLRACPLNAIKIEIICADTGQSNKLSNLTNGKRIFITPPYDICDEYEPMNEADTVFARVQFDSNFKYYQRTEFSGAEAMISKGLKGYTRFEHEIGVAAWILYDSRHTIKRPGIGLDSNAEELGQKILTEPTELTNMVKKAAKFFGADLVGIAELNRNWVYTHNRKGEQYNIPDLYSHAIVMAIEMDYDAIATSPSFTSAAVTGQGYSTMAFVEAQLASFVRRLGYNAMTCGNDVALSVPLAIDAGLGQYGRHGLLITKSYGPRVRIAKILTDMPLLQDCPDFQFCKAVVRFCETCKKCARMCPSQSIPYGKEQIWTGQSKSNNPGIKKWYVDVERCYGFWVENGSECSNCIRSCPYNKKDGLMHRSVLWVVQHLPWLNRLVVKMDDIVGYGKLKDTSVFWKKWQ